MKIKSKHRNGDVSIRMTNNTFIEFMRLLRENEDEILELSILEDQIVDEENLE